MAGHIRHISHGIYKKSQDDGTSDTSAGRDMPSPSSLAMCPRIARLLFHPPINCLALFPLAALHLAPLTTDPASEPIESTVLQTMSETLLYLHIVTPHERKRVVRQE